MIRREFEPHTGKQSEFLRCSDDWIFFGGARGGSKSFSLAWKAAFTPRVYSFYWQNNPISRKEYESLIRAGKQPDARIDKISIDYPDYIAIIIRRTFPQLERNLRPECDKLYPTYGARWQERNHCYVFPSGAKIYLVHCTDRKALDNYIGGNYNFLGIDEANQFPWEWVESLSTSVRTDNPELQPQICLTSNPGNIGHKWLKERFVTPCKPIPKGKPIYSEEFKVSYQPTTSAPAYKDEEGITWKFIQAIVFDNPSLVNNDPGYVKRLKKLNPILRKMWLEGDWDVFQGMFFDIWNELYHTIPEKEFKYGKQFNKDTHALYRFYDWGTKAPFVCLFGALSKEGELIIFDEIVETGLSSTKQARLVNKYTREKYKLTSNDFMDEIADPQMWARVTQDKKGNLYSQQEHYADEGIILSRGNNDRKVGAAVVYNALDIPDFDDGMPRIRFTDNCQYCIETIPLLQSKENDPEDVDTNGEDHAYDAVRMGAMELLPQLVEEVKQEQKGWRYEMAHQYDNDQIPGTTYLST